MGIAYPFAPGPGVKTRAGEPGLLIARQKYGGPPERTGRRRATAALRGVARSCGEVVRFAQPAIGAAIRSAGVDGRGTVRATVSSGSISPRKRSGAVRRARAAASAANASTVAARPHIGPRDARRVPPDRRRFRSTARPSDRKRRTPPSRTRRARDPATGCPQSVPRTCPWPAS